MGVYVPQQPTTSILRVFFFLCVPFCFAISTVFQAFFVSYLVEPNYEKKLDTLDELLKSDVVYGYQPAVDITQYFLEFDEFNTFLENKTLKEDCSDFRKCVERIITKRDFAAVISPMFATYVAREMGIVDVDKIICSFSDDLVSGGATVLFKNGNILLDRFNNLMRRYLEAGLLERHWTELQHRASLKGGDRYRQAAGDMFSAFSVSHLKPAFVVLFVGTVLSSVVFIVEVILKSLCKGRKKSICPLEE